MSTYPGSVAGPFPRVSGRFERRDTLDGLESRSRGFFPYGTFGVLWCCIHLLNDPKILDGTSQVA